jgi:integrase
LERPQSSPDRARWLTEAETDRLIESCADHLRPRVIFLLYTGARVGEALWLDWRCVDLYRRHVTFPKTKNGQRRGIPLHQRVVIALANLPHREGEVFRRPDGLPYERPKRSDDHSAGTRIKTAFKAACRRASITDFHPHNCRHTWATWHYIANRDLGALKRLGGWKSVRMVMRYAHTNVDEFKHTIDRLPGGKMGDTIDEGAKTA